MDSPIRGSRGTPVFLNIYDIHEGNQYTHWVGLGIFHSGVQVYDNEYSFGGHWMPVTGVFVVEPLTAYRERGATVRESRYLGRTQMSKPQVKELIDTMAHEYLGNEYNLLNRNCNHFAEDLVLRLNIDSSDVSNNPSFLSSLGKFLGLRGPTDPPGYVNRLARVASYFSCILPQELTTDGIAREACSPASSTGSPSIRMPAPPPGSMK